MKRKIQYVTVDGQTFNDRRQAAAHEVAVVRVDRIKDCLIKRCGFKADQKVEVDQIAAKIGEHASEFAELVSARATKRFIAKSESAFVVGRRPRGAVADAAASSAA